LIESVVDLAVAVIVDAVARFGHFGDKSLTLRPQSILVALLLSHLADVLSIGLAGACLADFAIATDAFAPVSVIVTRLFACFASESRGGASLCLLWSTGDALVF
jgi:hypothetical protein